MKVENINMEIIIKKGNTRNFQNVWITLDQKTGKYFVYLNGDKIARDLTEKQADQKYRQMRKENY